MKTITLSHKICLDPTFKQANYFARACGVSRFVWNWALNEWQRQYESYQSNPGLKKPGGLELKKNLNKIKATDYPWMYEVTKYASQQPFIFLQGAFSRFFKGQAHYPQFKKKGVHDSFYIGNDHIQVKGRQIRIPKLGWVRMREALRFSGRVISATVSRTADRWFVSLNVELNEPRTIYENQINCGVDLGITKLATIYNGESYTEVDGPKPLKKLLQKLKRCSKRLSAKQKSSNNRNKARLKLARLHARIHNIRQDSLHKLTTDLARYHKAIVIENLNVKGMLKNHCLARSIADMGFYEFKRQLEYKTKLYGSHLKLADRWYASTKMCSNCGEKKESMSLADRKYKCAHCGLELDRDQNAAKNLFSTASSAGFQACGDVSSGPSNFV